MVIIDSNIVIDHLRQPKKKDSHLVKLVREKPKESLALSMISVQELYEGKSTKNAQKERFLLAVISPLKILPYTYEIAKLAGAIARDINRPIELADAAIAATTINTGASLFTLNKRNFRGIKKLRLYASY